MGNSLLATLRPRHGLVQDTGTVGDGRAGLRMARGDLRRSNDNPPTDDSMPNPDRLGGSPQNVRLRLRRGG
ncbi:hypothetical protein IU479_31060 [Nocardia abscessus]|uniref:hypothetical protein n=1 Tax=Nocardia TaxID=1817 RepID=UPI0018961E6B|nr:MULTISPECIES: hypothetical protein [Nocardia]MBF6222537.1 hypothetical protein [Nocardia abscessus]MDE1672908.1 hypothetical protein [Nocardia gipuzkoensis]